MNSTARQPSHCASRPPRISPTANPALAIPEYSARARTRAFGSVKTVFSSASAFGPAMAAPTPWATRAPSSQPGDCARPPASDAAVNRATPAVNSRRRPKRSPARPLTSSSPPNARV